MKSVVKSCLRMLTRQLRVRIKSGPCEGLFWSLPTRMNFIRGVYEKKFARFISATVRPDDVFWDVGAHFGYYSLLASKATPDGQCYSFEPNPENRWYLEHHILWNKLRNITAFPYAIARDNGSRSFGDAGGSGAGKLDSGSLQVQTRSITWLIGSETCRAPTFMKIDVEGAEAEVLNGGLTCQATDLLCIATHGISVHKACGEILNRNGYRVHDFPNQSLLIGTGRDRVISDATMKLISEPGEPGA